MLRFYYSLGEEIISLKAESRWGSGFYKKLSSDLQKEIPNVKGFSVTNLKYMRKFYEMYSPLNRQQPVDDLQMIFSRSEEHTSELQSRQYLVCRLLLEKKKNEIYKYADGILTNASYIQLETEVIYARIYTSLRSCTRCAFSSMLSDIPKILIQH